MNLKRGLVALVAAGSMAGIAFGGSAVSTAFTSEQQGAATVNGGYVSLSAQNASFTVNGLQPGGTTSPSTVTVTNNSNVATALYLIGGTPGVTKNGANGVAPAASQLTVNVEVPAISKTFSYPVSSLVGHAVQLYSGIPADYHSPISVQVSFTLDQGAGNNWNGASMQLPYTLHLQDISGTDANGYVPAS